MSSYGLDGEMCLCTVMDVASFRIDMSCGYQLKVA